MVFFASTPSSILTKNLLIIKFTPSLFLSYATKMVSIINFTCRSLFPTRNKRIICLFFLFINIIIVYRINIGVVWIAGIIEIKRIILRWFVKVFSGSYLYIFLEICFCLLGFYPISCIFDIHIVFCLFFFLLFLFLIFIYVCYGML